MKPKTKKILIVVAAIVAVAIIVWLVSRKNSKNSTAAIINRLDADDSTKSMIKSRLAYIETYAATADATSAWSREQFQKKAKERGVTYEQELVIEAIYSLVDSGSIDQATGLELIAQAKQ